MYIYLKYTSFPERLIANHDQMLEVVKNVSICGYVFERIHYIGAITNMDSPVFEWMCDNLCAKEAFLAAISTNNIAAIRYSMTAYLAVAKIFGEINYEIFEALDI